MSNNPKQEAGRMKTRTRIFGRQQGGTTRWYLRAGDYADVGGRSKEALTLPGNTASSSAICKPGTAYLSG